jgi:hypothetical protein
LSGHIIAIPQLVLGFLTFHHFDPHLLVTLLKEVRAGLNALSDPDHPSEGLQINVPQSDERF